MEDHMNRKTPLSGSPGSGVFMSKYVFFFSTLEKDIKLWYNNRLATTDADERGYKMLLTILLSVMMMLGLKGFDIGFFDRVLQCIHFNKNPPKNVGGIFVNLLIFLKYCSIISTG